MIYVLCETAWISVVCLTTSSGARRPFESIRWEAKMVLIKVDFPRPVCPREAVSRNLPWRLLWPLTDTYDVKLEAALQELALNLGGYAVETNMAFGHYRILLRRHPLVRSHTSLRRHLLLGGHCLCHDAVCYSFFDLCAWLNCESSYTRSSFWCQLKGAD